MASKSRRESILYYIILYCIVLYCIVLYCIVLYCIVLYCIVLYYIILAVTMEVVQNHVSDELHVTPLSKNKLVQNICSVYFSFENYFYLMIIFFIKAEY